MRNASSPADPRPLEEDDLEYWRADVLHRAADALIALYARRNRDDPRINQSWVAARLGKNKGLISRRLAGEARMTLATLSDMARALGGRVRVQIEFLGDLAPADETFAEAAVVPIGRSARKRATPMPETRAKPAAARSRPRRPDDSAGKKRRRGR